MKTKKGNTKDDPNASGKRFNKKKVGNNMKAKGKGRKLQPKRGEWNLVPLGEEYFTDKEFENLVSFEELVDYDVVSKPDGTKEILSGKVGQNPAQLKRKADGEDESPVEINKDKPIKDGNKKRKKQQNGATEEVINTSAGTVIVEDDNTTLKHKSVKNGEKTANSKSSSKKEEKPKKGKRKQTEKMKQIEESHKGEETDEDSDEANGNDGAVGADSENLEFKKQEWVKLGVPDIIIKSLKEKGFNTPTTIQALTLPSAILGRKDVVGAAETGSGKTLAFAIPIIHGILKQRNHSEDDSDNSEQPLKALILTPTRELAVQIKNHFDVAAKHTTIKTVVIVGGLAAPKQERLLRGKPDVVIATPGRLWELLQEGDPHLSTLNRIGFLAIDETDRMVEKGRFQELEGILNILNTNAPSKVQRQNFVFSATLAFTHEPPKRFKKAGLKKFKPQQPKKISSKDKLKQIMEMVGVRPNPKIVDITTSKRTCETLIEMQISCTLDHKDYYLYYFLLQNPGRTIVFCNSINCVRRLTNLLFLLEFDEVIPLHSEMAQKQRLRSLERFTENEKGILVATDVAARGLDIQNIQHVLHYHVPKTAESYIHRSGRTARAFKGGVAILMIEPGETTTVKNIFRSLDRDEMLPNFEVNGKIFRDIKNTVEMAIKVEQFEHSVRKKLSDYNWIEKAKKDMDLASSSEESEDDGDGNARQKKALLQAKKQLDGYKKQLSQMLLSNNKRSS